MAADEKGYYKALGIEPELSFKYSMNDIASAFKETLAHTDDKTERRKIKQAYRVLGNAVSRYRYDGLVKEQLVTHTPTPPAKKENRPVSSVALEKELAPSNEEPKASPPVRPSAIDGRTVSTAVQQSSVPVIKQIPWDEVDYVIVREHIVIEEEF